MQKLTARRFLSILAALFIFALLYPFSFVPDSVEAAPNEVPQAQVCNSDWRTQVHWTGTYVAFNRHAAVKFTLFEELCGYHTYGKGWYAIDVPCWKFLKNGQPLAAPYGANCVVHSLKYIQVR